MTRLNVLITGGLGFIGSHIARAVANNPNFSEIRIIDNLSSGYRRNVEGIESRIEIIEGNILDSTILQNALKNIDIVFHESAIASVPKSIENPIITHLNGSHATVALLDAAVRAGVKRVILASTSAAYGNTGLIPQHEELIPQPISPYAASKVASELYAASFSQCYSIDTVSLRYFNVYGPYQDPSSQYSGVISRFCEAISKKNQITIFGDGSQTRDFVYVADIAEANVRTALQVNAFHGGILNVASGCSITILELVKALEMVSGRKLTINFKPGRNGEVLKSSATVEKLFNLLKWKPSTAIEYGLSKTLSWYMSQNNAT